MNMKRPFVQPVRPPTGARITLLHAVPAKQTASKPTQGPSHASATPLVKPQRGAGEEPSTSGAVVETQQQQEQQRQQYLGGLKSRLITWLPWTTSVPLASQLGREGGLSSMSEDDALTNGDGMASSQPDIVPLEKSRKRSWYRSASPVLKKKVDDGNKYGALASVLEHRHVQVDHPTLRLLRQRIVSKSRPGERTDPFKLGLVVEGGGMRGCVSGGGLQALNDLGLRDVFDACYGSSAGAINSTFFLTEQREGVGIYYNHIASEEFIDLRRLLSRRPGLPPALNLEFLLEHVMERVQPLDWDAVLRSDIPLKVVASSLNTLGPVLLENFMDKSDLVSCLRASATVPEVAGGPVNHRGHSLVDAAVFEPVPFRSAVADGCTHVLVLCTRPAPAHKSPLDQALADALETAIKKAVMSPDYMKPAWQAEVDALMADGLNQDEMLLRSLDEDADSLPWFAGAAVYPLYPDPSGSSFSPVCTDIQTLKNGVAEGRRAVLAMAQAALGDVVNVTPHLQREAANIIPLATRSASGRAATERLWRRHLASEDFSHHRSRA